MVMFGARGLTDGASAVAYKLRVSPMIIGLTVVALGTSAPELFISLSSTLHKTSDMAVANVVGSNIFNTLFIVGVASMAAPMILNKGTVAREIPVGVLATYILFGLTMDREISVFDAALLFVSFLGFLIYTVVLARFDYYDSIAEGKEDKIHEIRPMAWWKALIFIILGLFGLIYGSDIFVDAAVKIARSLAVSDAIIGMTIVAGGTSLPELATTVVAARKGHSEIAIGNVIGSNVFNVLMILGVSGLISPLKLYEITMVDFAVLAGSSMLIWIFSYTRLTIERWEGALLTSCFVVYMGWLIYNV